MIAGTIAQSISIPFDECAGPASDGRGVNALLRRASCATMQIAAAIQKITTDSELSACVCTQLSYSRRKGLCSTVCA
jgi:hypothetical protein